MTEKKIYKLEESYYEHTLDCGLKIIIFPNKKTKNYYLTLSVKFGALDEQYIEENKEIHLPNGTAHFLEHLKFYQKDRDVFNYFTNLGSYPNAYTSYEQTTYIVESSDKLKQNLSCLLKYVNTPYFTKKLVEKEKGIITEEIKSGEDHNGRKMNNAILNTIFKAPKIQEPVAGKVEDIKKIKLKHINKAYESFYHPENMLLVVTGGVDPEKVINIANETLLKIKFKDYKKPERIKTKEPAELNIENNIVNGNISQPKLAISVKMKGTNLTDERKTLYYIQQIIATQFGNTSIINEKLKDENLITSNLDITTFKEGEYYIISFYTETSKTNKVIKYIKESLKNIEFDEKMLRIKLNAGLSKLLLAFDDIYTVNDLLVISYLGYKKIDDNMFKMFEEIDKELAIKIIDKIKESPVGTTILKASK